MEIDLMRILDAVVAPDTVVSLMNAGVTLAGVYALVFAFMNLLIIGRGGEAWSWGLSSHIEWFREASRNREFKRRYALEIKSRQYSAWKKSKGL